MNVGVVIWYDPKKGFGKIKSDDKLFFYHRTEIKSAKPPRPKQLVTFRPITTKKGDAALNVELVARNADTFPKPLVNNYSKKFLSLCLAVKNFFSR
ncbi:cold-shock protein [Photobacterium leiognathi]|uniref:cold-shock protein n=1 Tax=Photobacterium leiognathi TaxID=553611 RepID=UPI002981241C|nr:hypothetical protein [Photobacterium leiognathi]